MNLLRQIQQHKYLLWFILCLAFCGLFWWQAQLTAIQSVSQQLQQQLPLKLKNALYYSDKNSPVTDLIRHTLEQDLALLPGQSSLALISQCQAQVTQLLNEAGKASHSFPSDIVITWMMGNNKQNTQINLRCHTHWPGFILPIALASLLVSVFIYLPQPLSARSRDIQAYLLSQCYTQRDALKWAKQLEPLNHKQYLLFKQLQTGKQTAELIHWIARSEIANLNETQLNWFQLALTQFKVSKEQALTVALTEDELRFVPDKGVLFIRGLPLTLLKTPYLYYLWYACLRKKTQGWHLNPAVNRADYDAANSLINLMQQFGGHNKAISDLHEFGLRAKTLDQNRNKLKIELVNLLGESLAKPYLFDTERDSKTGRYRYRLTLEEQHIHLPAINY